MGTAASYGVLAGSTVTNSGTSVIDGDLGLSPGTAVTGAPTVLGATHVTDDAADKAQADLIIAYDDVAGQASDGLISADLADEVLTTGVYTSASTMGLSGQLTLDAQGDSSALFVFQVGSALDIATGSAVILTNGAQACNVFWQVGSSAELKTGASFVGTVIALTSISVGADVTVQGRLLARNGAVTLINDRITVPTCAAPTSDVPTSDVPTSDVPTTDVPASGGPTSDVPTSDVPTSDVPTTDVPTSGGPTDDGPTDDGPTNEESRYPLTGQPEGGQISQVPAGFPDTGDGGSMGGASLKLVGAGSLSLLLVAGLLLHWWRRETPTG